MQFPDVQETSSTQVCTEDAWVTLPESLSGQQNNNSKSKQSSQK